MNACNLHKPERKLLSQTNYNYQLACINMIWIVDNNQIQIQIIFLTDFSTKIIPVHSLPLPTLISEPNSPFPYIPPLLILPFYAPFYIIIKIITKKNMTCNQYLSLQKNPLFGMPPEDALHYINPFGQLLFCQKWKWSQLHLPGQKMKINHSQTSPSLKKDILLWFENLTANEKISVTTINNPQFCLNFIKMLPQRNSNRLFNLTSQQSIDGIDSCEKDPFFDELLQQLRVAYLSQPILYIQNAQIMGVKMLEWLNRVSSSRIFEYASKSKKGQENPLWFSSHSYHFLENWLVNQLEISIVQHFLDKNVPEQILSELQSHFKSLGKHQQANGLSLYLSDAVKKSNAEITSLRQKIKEEEEKFMEMRQLKLLSSMETVEKTKKKNKKKGKKNGRKQQISPSPDEQKKVESQEKEETVEIVSPKKNQKKKKETTPKQTKKEDSPKVEEIKETQTPNHSSIQKDKNSSHSHKKRSISKNLIRVSPRRRSPEQIRSKDMYSSQIRQKYSEEDKISVTMTQEQNVSDHVNSYDDLALEEKQTVKRRRKRGKKQNQKLNEVRELLFSRFLNRQIQSLVDQLGMQTNSLYNHKILAFERVRTFSQNLFPMTNAVLFGSNAVGLSLPNSDVDILLTCMNCYCKEAAADMLAQIAVEINAMGWVVSCSTYLWAKVPLVKLQIDTSIPFVQTKRKQDLFQMFYNPALLYHLDHHDANVPRVTIKVDITINVEGITSAGFQSTSLMRNYLTKIPVVQKLVLLFKYILSIRGFNSNFTGGIGSYNLFVMIAAYLKTFKEDESSDIGQCFMKLLRWYGQQFDNYNNVILLRQQGSCFIHKNEAQYQYEEGKVGFLKIVDPITNRLMSSSCNEYSNIKLQFKRIETQMKNWRSLIEQQLKINGINQNQLLRLSGSKKSLDKWLNKYQQKYKSSLQGLIQCFN